MLDFHVGRDGEDLKAKSMQLHCKTPCGTLDTQFGIPTMQPFGKQDYHLKFYFKTHISVKRSFAEYDFRNFLAEIGGYMGLFLGVSLMDSYKILDKIRKTINERAALLPK